MSRPVTFRVLGAIAFMLVVSAVPSALGSPSSSSAFPTNPQRLATDNGIFFSGLLSLGYKPACATFNPATISPPYKPLVKGITPITFVLATGFDDEQLAACKPDGIVTSDGNQPPDIHGTNDEAIAPTVYIKQPNPPVDASGKVISTWKDWFFNLGQAMGQSTKATKVIANVDRRASALRGLVSGKSIGVISLASPSTFDSPNNYLPLATIYTQDLGMKNLMLKDSAYSSTCLSTTKPSPCYSTPQSSEVLGDLSSADVVLLQYLLQSGSNIQSFENDPLFSAIPAIKAGRFAQTQGFTDVGPIGVGWMYTAIEHALGIAEYFTTVTGGAGGQASITLDRATHKACLSVTPTPGKQATGAIVLKKGTSSFTLIKSPKWTALESNADWQTSPSTMQSTGCATVPAAFQSMWTKSPSSVSLSFSGGSAKLKHGSPSVAYSS